MDYRAEIRGHKGTPHSMSNCSLQDAQRVLTWIAKNTGFWESSLQLKNSPLGGVGVFTTTELEEPAMEPKILLRLYKRSLLSAMNSCIGNLVTDEELDGVLALILSFIYERDQGDASPWSEYISTIRYHNDKGQLILPPSLWSKGEKSLLYGSELELMGGLDDEEMQVAYETACSFALKQSESASLPVPYEFDIIDKTEEELLDKYNTFVAISHQIAARDFEVDEFHQVALCPGADLFNHSVRNNARFESLFDVCIQCGDSLCDHLMEERDHAEEMDDDDDDEHGHGHDEDEDSDLELSQDYEDQQDDEQNDDKQEEDDEQQEQEEGDEEEEPEFEGTMEEFITMIESAIEEEKIQAQHEREQEQEQEQQSSQPKLFDDDKPIDADACVDIVLHHSAKQGDELFNTYGDFSNAVLLSKYGFVIPGNTNDIVSLGMEFIRLKKKKQYSRMFSWWEAEGYDAVRDLLHTSKHDDDHEHGGCDDDGCDDDDGCCGGAEDEQVPSWSMEMKLEKSGEPSPLTFALAKLLSLNTAEFTKFIGKGTKINLQLLTMSSAKAYKLLSAIVEERSKVYTGAKFTKLLKSKNDREQMAAQLVLDELAIIERATLFFNKRS